MDNYKDECMKRFEYSKSYEKYNQEDLIDELYEKDIQNEDLQQRINKAIEFVESMEYCGQEDYFYDNKSEDPCGNDNTFNDSKNKLLDILKGDDTNE